MSLLWRTHALQSRQLEINAPLRHELVVSSFLNNLALIKYVDEIGVLDGAQTMRYGDRGSALSSGVESILDNAFRGGVERGGGFIEETMAC